MRERPPETRIAIVGAGVAGLAAARTLADNGEEPVIFDKGRAPGGRTSARRTGVGHIDHGAQYFTARNDAFAREVDSWADAGVAHLWHARLVRFDPSGRATPMQDARRWVGVPHMRAIAEHLARDLDIRCRVRVGACELEEGRWRLRSDEGSRLGEFEAIIVAVPPEQAEALLWASPPLRRAAASVRMIPCWATMLTLSATAPIGFDGASFEAGPIAWVSRDSSKPGRAPGERWVIHASEHFSLEHLEAAPERIAELLTAHFARLLDGPLPEILDRAAHRWRYARPASPLAADAIADPPRRAALAGDWLRAGRIEDAWLSGVAAATKLLKTLATPRLPAL